FIPMKYLGLTTNIMSLGGIAIAIGELADAAICLVENANVRLSEADPKADRKAIIIQACKEVGTPIFFSLLLITVSFAPIFTLAGQAGRLFRPLAFTKTFAMLAASLLSITLAPPLMALLLRGKFRREEDNPVSRWLSRAYRPVARAVVRGRWIVVALAVAIFAGTVPIASSIGSEFMPPLDEGSLLVMPTTFPGISIEEARRALQAQDRIIRSFPEVKSVHGKAGRADTATDPAQLDMIETVVMLHPRDRWPTRPAARWYSSWAPGWLKPVLAPLWPEERPRTTDELASALSEALRTPGFQIAVAPPIRTRIDMLTTGVRTPVGVKVIGENLAEIERISLALEGLLRDVPGARSTFAERQTGREYVDIVPDRRRIARYGLTVRDVNDVVEAAVGGMQVSTVIAGRARFSVNLRYAADFRGTPDSLRRILVPVPFAPSALVLGGAGTGSGESVSGGGAMAPSRGGGSGGMGMGGSGASSRSGSSAMGGDSGMADASGGGTSATGARGGGDPLARWAQQRPTVQLGELASVEVVSGPPMIKDENGSLVGYVFVDVDTSSRDLGGFVRDAKRAVAGNLSLPPGYRLVWTGQYEFLEQMEARLRYVLPLTLLLIVILLYMSMKGWQQTALVLLALPFALVGSFWLLFAMDYNLSTAVWVGLIAVAGVAAQTGIVMIVYLDEAFERHRASGKLSSPSDVDAAVIEGASMRARPLLMTVATTVLGLAPLLWESGVGADVSARTAAPVVGGLWSCMFLTLLVLPAAYTIWRRHQVASSGGRP
ncbi:MAG: efflux RND transporter permease subunit, partial [Deltaproteobacteria bacterium]|nr:efflux RND transporter permease subunit [Deltaproteobacteria bacterium]